MKIYLASVAPGTEGTEAIPILLPCPPLRLLSYHHIVKNMFGTKIVFQAIKQIKEKQ